MLFAYKHAGVYPPRRTRGDEVMPFVAVDVTPDVIAQAKKIRMERDQHYGNIYREEATDLRWVGEIGEICFNSWVRQHTGLSVEWILDHTAGKPDFRIGEARVGIKTVKRQVAVKPEYTAQITARHAGEPVAHFFFACYEVPRNRLWLLGGITKEDFLANARYYREGEQVHPHYTVRAGHEIYNIELARLTPPDVWLQSLNLLRRQNEKMST
jgi:hypothetical protein